MRRSLRAAIVVGGIGAVALTAGCGSDGGQGGRKASAKPARPSARETAKAAALRDCERTWNAPENAHERANTSIAAMDTSSLTGGPVGAILGLTGDVCVLVAGDPDNPAIALREAGAWRAYGAAGPFSDAGAMASTKPDISEAGTVDALNVVFLANSGGDTSDAGVFHRR